MKKKIAIILGLCVLAVASIAISDALHEILDPNIVEAKEEIYIEEGNGEDNIAAFSKDRVIEIALNYVGVEPEDASRINIDLDLDSRYLIYDIEFRANDKDYWVEVCVKTEGIHDFGIITS